MFELNDRNAEVSDPAMPAVAIRKDKHPLAIMVSGCGAGPFYTKVVLYPPNLVVCELSARCT